MHLEHCPPLFKPWITTIQYYNHYPPLSLTRPRQLHPRGHFCPQLLAARNASTATAQLACEQFVVSGGECAGVWRPRFRPADFQSRPSIRWSERRVEVLYRLWVFINYQVRVLWLYYRVKKFIWVSEKTDVWELCVCVVFVWSVY